ncbi:type VI secretion system-associated protein TagF [Variovorax sp. W6]|uniref:type VI secretion system-associated protein TagF n=1 Tax=Variovorax sp. W6 TaxID=3093895 RepID=UPI003D802E14
MSIEPSSLLASTTALPGWFGKLPGMGDFAHRRLPEPFRAVWDQWLQRGMSRLRDQPDWTERYLEAPIWCFALGRQVAGDQAWIGVLMPSVDGVGRYFPFAIAVELDADSPGTLRGEALAAALGWWAHATQAALEGLDGDLDAVRFDAVLQRLFVGDVVASSSGGREGVVESLELPVAGASLWLSDPSVGSGIRMLSTGLPRDEQFEALFLGFAEEG